MFGLAVVLGGELGLEVGVGGRAERDPLPFPVDDQPGGHRLHPPGGQLGHDLLPQHGRDLVPVQPVEHAARLVGVDLALVELLRVGDGPGDRLRGDLVEDHPAGRHLGLELLEQVPGDGLALAVLISGEQEFVGVLEQALELGDLLPLVAVHDVQRLEVVVYVDAEPGPRLAAVLGRDLGRAVGHVADVADAGLDHVALAEVAGDGPGLGRGLDDDQLGAMAVTRRGPGPGGPGAYRPWPVLLALAVAAAFVFAVSVLAGTLFPSSHPRRDRLRYPWSHAALQLQPSARFGVFPQVRRNTPQILLPQVESPVNSSTIGPMAEYAYLVVYLPRGTSRDARDAARRILTDHAEYGDWELARLLLNADGSRKATLRRRIIRPVRTF